ncbi:NAD(P)-dependent oxidoreductase [Alloscardovia venturai]|uniref:NAD(P)-dependent oxidoreductase n=1 Tax=Alloscardovia venturai TaxID=1769421 RepID=A0ABW2Y300_9BIFI
MTEKILVTGIVPREGLDELFDRFDVTYSDGEPFSREWVLEHAPEYDGMILMAQKGDREFIDAFTNLKIISLNAVGFDHVDTAYAKEKGIAVCNSPQAVRVPTAELTFSLILAAAKRLYFYDSVVRRGDWMDVSERRLQGRTLEGLTLGVFGMGRIGRTVADFGKAFGMKIIYNDAYRLDESVEKDKGYEFVSFDELVKRSDIVTIHAPALDSTRGLFNAETFAKMKHDAIIVNAARGVIIEEQALVDALENGQIAGAGLDVFEFEPTVSSKLRAMSNVIMSPHAGTGTIEGRAALAAEAAHNIVSFFDGEPINVVNK